MLSVYLYYYGKQAQLQSRDLHFVILLLPSTWGMFSLVDKESLQMCLNNRPQFCAVHHVLWPWPQLYFCSNLFIMPSMKVSWKRSIPSWSELHFIQSLTINIILYFQNLWSKAISSYEAWLTSLLSFYFKEYI